MKTKEFLKKFTTMYKDAAIKMEPHRASEMEGFNITTLDDAMGVIESLLKLNAYTTENLRDLEYQYDKIGEDIAYLKDMIED